ncbi:SGNH/GDSL hydrolase family protein [Gordonia alkaliphila]|uniref:SGNH/GDSL hydrolase family protein n=1 Tax=Gordonia alkaliphila TaxID=1053547 RepID=UPI001FF30D30|nr:SGNH/GDSL hydrolase family protein [Gordonia alkaliphila]MCK0440945.1 SGNH/GDSL hydrolase family protein [Gordonia alkaliphila]
MTFSRYVALGDSFTEGVGDHAPELPGAVRGWADRVAAALDAASRAAGEPGLEYANLAIRGRKLKAVIDEQLAPALTMTPDLVTVHAGGNDILRPTVDLDELLAYYDDAIAQLVATGATVAIFTPHDPGGAPVFGTLRGRFAILAEGMRQIADTRGAVLVDYWRIRDFDDRRLWDFDRMHMSAVGHQRMAIAVLDALGVDHDLTPTSLPPTPELTTAQARSADLDWARRFLAPWIGRRLRGVSSGDDLTPRYPEPVAVEAVSSRCQLAQNASTASTEPTDANDCAAR